VGVADGGAVAVDVGPVDGAGEGEAAAIDSGDELGGTADAADGPGVAAFESQAATTPTISIARIIRWRFMAGPSPSTPNTIDVTTAPTLGWSIHYAAWAGAMRTAGSLA
jgi:hypothetical protein